MKEPAIVYFSRNGSTRLAAQILSERIGATMVELQEKKARTGFLASGFRAKSGKHSELAGDPWAEVKESEVVVLAAPIWAGSGNPAMNGFLDKAELAGKRVFLLTVQADPDHSRSEEVLEHYAGRVRDAGGTVQDTRAITGASPGKTATEEDLRTALEGWSIK